MSKRGYIHRYLLIVKKLQKRPYSTYQEIQSYIDNQFEYLQTNDDDLGVTFSKRTFLRDKTDIKKIFGVNIEYSISKKGYYIDQSDNESMNFDRMMEAFDLFNSLNLAQDAAPFIHMEKRKPLGTENLYGLIHAIKNKLLIEFTYQKFWEEEISQRLVEPYALKEFKNRWYVMAKDSKDAIIKSFALDRLTNLDVTIKTFISPKFYNIEESYRYSFGIIDSNDEEPQEIILAFNPLQGKYIKSLPLHHTQQVLIDNEHELKIKLKLCVTHDLLMELLSFSNNMKVLQPLSLVETIKTTHQKAFYQYE